MTGRTTCGCKGAAAAHCRNSRHRRRASPAGGRRAGLLRHDRPHAGRAARAQRQHDRHQHQCQPELVRAGHAQFLDRSEDRHSRITSRCRRRNTKSNSLNDLRNTPVSTVTVAERQPGPGHAQQCRHVQARTACRPTPIRPTSSRSTTSMPACRAAISAASPTEINKIVAELQKQLKPGNSSRSSARSRA